MITITGTISVSQCVAGVYLRWWFNGWHYFNFTNGYEIEMVTESMGIQTTNFFSVISKTERDTRIKSEYSYKITLQGISAANIPGFTGLLMAEMVEQYEDLIWREVQITRGNHMIKDSGTNGYEIEFEITRKELPGTSSVYQKSLRLYLGDILCDMDDDEIVPVNKQTNNISEMQDRQSDFTAQFRIRKTRAMRDLFELSGEVGATTEFPYQRQSCKLIQDNIEVITGGLLILDKVEDQYYLVSILSGNINFFNLISGKKITDLTLPGCVHTWNAAYMAATHSVVSPGTDVVYPLCEPSDDASIAEQTDDGDKIEMYGGWIWPFVRVRAIWEEIFSSAGYTVTGGDIINSTIFDNLYLPISSLKVNNTDKYLYSQYWNGSRTSLNNQRLCETHFPGVIQISGDANFKLGYFYAPYDGTYNLSAKVVGNIFTGSPILSVYKTGSYQGAMNITIGYFEWTYEIELEGVNAGDHISILTNAAYYSYWFWGVTKITKAQIAYGSIVDTPLHLPPITQIDFIKMICNLFGLVPEVSARDHNIRFWNYDELYNNISIARDWSSYLSERDDEVEFKFGDYAQNNYLKYKQSEDVIVDNGTSNLPFEDKTLPEDKDIVQLVLSTCDEVIILNNNFSVNVSRIGFNKWSDDDAEYSSNSTIDARIVYIDFCREIASPAYKKSFWIRPTVAPLSGLFAAPSLEVETPKIASSLPVSFSALIRYYSSLSRLLTKPNLRRSKFNLPVYEVAGIRHNIPIYLSQYKAYFYVNKISNYVPGQLCTIELIRL